MDSQGVDSVRARALLFQARKKRKAPILRKKRSRKAYETLKNVSSRGGRQKCRKTKKVSWAKNML